MQAGYLLQDLRSCLVSNHAGGRGRETAKRKTMIRIHVVYVLAAMVTCFLLGQAIGEEVALSRLTAKRCSETASMPERRK